MNNTYAVRLVLNNGSVVTPKTVTERHSDALQFGYHIAARGLKDQAIEPGEVKYFTIETRYNTGETYNSDQMTLF